MTLKLGINASPDNALTKNVNYIHTLNGNIKNNTSIIDPTIIIEANISSIATCDYMEIPAFNRKYFIKDMISISENLFEIHAHVDVLSTYNNSIKSNTAILKRHQKLFNKYLDDGSILKKCNSVQNTVLFPGGFSKPEYVLVVAGS